jgi:hypothetical protein
VSLGGGISRVDCHLEDGVECGWQQRIEALPDNAPPKWMFRNISVIRDNIERILELLERFAPSTATAAPRT